MSAGTDGGDAGDDLYAAAAVARDRWRRSDELLNRARLVRDELLAFGDEVDWAGRGVDELSAGSSIVPDLEAEERAAWDAVTEAVERFQVADDSVAALSFLVESGPEGETPPLTAFSVEHTVDAAVGSLVDALSGYAEGGSWGGVPDALADVPTGPAPVADAADLFEAVAVAALHDRVSQRSQVQAAIEAATDAVPDPLTTLDEQPVALFPVSLETRFIGPEDAELAEGDELWIRVYPDNVHAHTHEFELTTDERRLGKRFWATMWLAAHPDPDEIDVDPDGAYLTERFPDEPDLRRMLAGIDLDRFSSTHRARYDELKSRAWGKLVDRLGEDRADYVVHALAPTDGEGADLEYALLTPPELILPNFDGRSVMDSQVDTSQLSGGGWQPGPAVDDGETDGSDPQTDGGTDAPEEGGDADGDADDEMTDDADDDTDDDADDEMTDDADDDTDDDDTEDDADDDTDDDEPKSLAPMAAYLDAAGKYPGLSFPETPLRSHSWTKQPIAKLLPDRWVALLEWERNDGETGRKTIAGDSIEDPLPVGPRAELEGDDNDDVDPDDVDPDDHDPDGSEWTEEIGPAFEVGMALRVPLSDLPEYDDSRGIDRLVVVGAKASMDPETTATALTEQLASHQYTSGLSLLSPGTETNVDDADPVGALDEDPEAIGPPRVAELDLSDGDILARALALDASDGHPFAHVPGADSTDQLDARHANSALWPATLGYTLTNVLTPNELIGLESIWDDSNPTPALGGDELDPTEHLAWLDAYRRHFIRYVRSGGPFPTLRVGAQPYGVLPVTATHDTETAIPAPDPNVVAAIRAKELTVPEANEQGIRMSSLVQAQELSTDALIEAEAEPEELYEHDVDPVELIESGVEAATMRELGEDVDALVDRGADLPQLVQAGFEVVELESVGASIREVVEAGARPQQLARAGTTVAQLAGVDIPAEEIVRAGFTARDVISAGFTAADVVRGGAPPSALADLGIDRDTLRRLEAPAGSLRVAGVSADDLIDAGYSASELLNGGFAEEELAGTGVSLADVADAGRSAADLASEGVTVSGLRERGFGPDALMDSGYGPDALLEAGYTAGELLDANESVDAIVAAGADLGALKAADVSVSALVEAGADVEALREAGTGAAELAETGIGAEALAAAGYSPAELKAAGLPAEPAEPDADPDADDSAGGEPSVRTVSVTEPVGKAERDLYAFGFDPATSRTLSAGSGGSTGGMNYVTGPAGEKPSAGSAPTDETTSVDAAADSTVDADPSEYGADHVLDPAVVDAADREADVESIAGGSIVGDSVVGDSVVSGHGGIDVPPGVIEGDIVVKRPTPTDGRVAERIESFVTSLRPLWSEAADELPFASAGDDWAVLDALQREAVSRAARVDARVDPNHSADHAQSLRAFLTERDLRALDPRLAHMPLTSIEDGPLLEPHEIVDADLDVFVSMLRAESIEKLWTHSVETDLSLFRRSSGGAGSHRIDPSGFDDSLADAWGSLLPGARRAALYAALEEAEKPVELLDDVFPDRAAAGAQGEKLTNAAEFADDYADTGVFRSLARVLLHHGLLREYLEARARLGIAFDDPPSTPFDFLYFSNPAVTSYLSASDDLLQPNVPDPVVDAVYGTSRTESSGDASDDDDTSFGDASGSAPMTHEPIEGEFTQDVELTFDDDDDDGNLRSDGGDGSNGDVDSDGGASDGESDDGASDVDSGSITSFATADLDVAAVDTKASSYAASNYVAQTGATGAGNRTTQTEYTAKADYTVTGHAVETGSTLGAGEYVADQYVLPDAQRIDLEFYDPSYADVLRVIAADDATTTGLDPRLSEFTDSLAHLQTVEPSELATLIGGTLDLASHRLDAWWTSLATKRLFELRERQRVGTTAFDAWDVEGYDPDDVLAELDPSLASALDLEVGAGDDESTDDQAADDRDGFGDELAEGAEPGIYVGGYGVVHDLRPTPDDTPTYVHAPSVQQAETAALLRSGYLAGEAEEGENLLDVDLSAERVQDARWLLQGVKRGQSLGELLGYRFERRLHEVTMSATDQRQVRLGDPLWGQVIDALQSSSAGPNLMQYRKPLREAFPAVLGSLDYTDSPIDPEEAGRRAELAKSDVVDGYQLIRHWDEEYPFGYGSDLPDDGGDDDADPAYLALDRIVRELRDDVDAVSDLLIAESVHQLGKGDPDRAGLSLEALSTGAHLPDPEVTTLPRTETGLTHRGLVVLEADESPVDESDPHLRSVAEPSIERWASSLLPDLADVGCRVVYEWTEDAEESSGDGKSDGDGESDDESAEPSYYETSATMAVLDLTALDVLALAQDAEREGQSELERRFAYRLRRDRPEAVPPHASVSLTLTDPDEHAISVAALIEAARSLASLIDAGRPADGVDLVHPADPADPGYDEGSVDAIEARATAVETRLTEIEETLIDRVTPLGVDATALLGASGESSGTTDSTDETDDDPADETGDDPTDETGDDLTDETGDDPTDETGTDPIDETAALTTRADAVGEALDAVVDEGLLAAVEDATAALETADVASAFDALADELPAGPLEPSRASGTHRVVAESDQELRGAIGYVPAPPASADDGDDGGDGGDDGSGGDEGDDEDDGDGEDDGGSSHFFGLIDRTDLGIGDPAWLAAAADDEPTAADVLEYPTVDLGDVDGSIVDPELLSGGSAQFATIGGGGDGDAEAESDDSTDPGFASVDVYVWGVSGTTPFARSTTADVEGGRFVATVDFADVDPGAPFSIVAVADETVVYSATGRVLAADGEPKPNPAAVVEGDRDGLGALCWLAAVRESLRLDGDEPTLAELEAALEGLDFAAVTDVAGAVETDSPVLTEGDRDAVEALAALDPVDLATVVDACWDLIDVAVALGLDAAFEVYGPGTGHDGARIEPADGFAGVGDVRQRLRRVAADASVLRSSAPPRALAFDHAVGHLVAEAAEPTVTARTLDALVHAPPWVVAALADVVDRPALTLARLEAWVFDADGFAALAASDFDFADDAETEPAAHLADLAADLDAIAGATDDLGALFEGVSETDPAAAAGDALSELADELEELAASLDDPSDLAGWGVGVGSGSVDVTETIAADAADANDAVSTDWGLLAAAQAADGPTHLRRVLLERLREPLLAASFAGFYGSVPAAPVGEAREHERTLRTQATTLLVELDERLADVVALDPTHESYPNDRPLAQRVEDQVDRLTGLLDDEIPILVPFGPANGAELATTFAETVPPESAGPLAVERWFQRVSRVRSRPAKLRDAVSYAEALTGEFARDLTVGQLPYRPEDDWMGADGVEVERGRLSLVAQFGPDCEPTDIGGRVTALFVDEWVETVPAETERTGLAIQCDDPGNRPPQSILLALPPEGETWSLGALFGAVTETMAYAKLRSVDLDDLDEVDGVRSLLPGLYFPNDGRERPGTPSVNFDVVDWYDRRTDPLLLPKGVYEAPRVLEEARILAEEVAEDVTEEYSGDSA